MCQTSPPVAHAAHTGRAALLAAALAATLASCGDGRAPRAALETGTLDRTARAVPPDGLPLVPRPRHVAPCAGTFLVDAKTELVAVGAEPELTVPVARTLAQWLGLSAANVHAAPSAPTRPGQIVLRVDPESTRAPEAHTVDVTPEAVSLRGASPRALFYAAQTFAQLAGARLVAAAPRPPPHRAPCARVEDEPRTALRIMHLDVARHFFPREVVERYVDLLASYRFNAFHWHLTDDQGFRVEVRSHPELTAVGARRVEADGSIHAGAYSEDDVRAVVAHARARFVDVIPEIEMPGHARAILASHPELSCTGDKLAVPSTWGVFDDVLCAGNPATHALIADVLGDVSRLFPGPYVHLGGDEVPKARWSACPKCRAAMAKGHLGLEELEGELLARAASTLAAHGKVPMVWDEALAGGRLPADAIVVAWRGADRVSAAARAGHRVVAAPYDTVYFNYWQTEARGGPGHPGLVPWTRALGLEPAPPDLEPEAQARVIGGEGALWTEYVTTQDDLDALALPRMAALAEALWSGPPRSEPREDASRREASFAARFAAARPMLDASRVRYFVEPPTGLKARRAFLDAMPLVLSAPGSFPDGVVRYTTDGSEPTSRSPVFAAPVILRATTDVAARLFLSGGRESAAARGRFVKEAPRPGLALGALRDGVKYTYIEADLRALPDFAGANPKRRGELSRLAFAEGFRAERFAVLYEGLVRVPESGVVRFVARADDGVALDVDGERVLEDDGEHAARDAEGEIALAAGTHAVRLSYFQGGGGKELTLKCEGPSMPLGPCVFMLPK